MGKPPIDATRYKLHEYGMTPGIDLIREGLNGYLGINSRTQGILTEAIKTPNSVITAQFTSLQLSETTYMEIVQRLEPVRKAEFDNDNDLLAFIIDYIDMVHDMTKCFEYMIKMLENIKRSGNKRAKVAGKNDKYDRYIKRLEEIIRELCTQKGNNIRVETSHAIQKRLLNEHIQYLNRTYGTNLTPFEDPVLVTLENASKHADMDYCCRESAGSLSKFFAAANVAAGRDVAKVPKEVSGDLLTAVDGCKGPCPLLIEGTKADWICKIAGIFPVNVHVEVHMSQEQRKKYKKTHITIRVPDDIAQANPTEGVGTNAIGYHEFVFEIIGDGTITRDDVVRLIDGIEEFGLRGEEEEVGGERVERDNNIRPNFNFKTDNPLHCMLAIVLKCLCDKRWTHLLQAGKEFDGTKSEGLGGVVKIIGAQSTIDGYLAAIMQLEYIKGNVKYIPDVWCKTGEKRYNKFSLGNKPGNLDLKERYACYMLGLKHFYPDSTDSTYIPMTYNLDFTTLYLKNIAEKGISSPSDMLIILAVQGLQTKWKQKLENFKDAIDAVTAARDSIAFKTALLNIPLVLNMLQELGDLTDEMAKPFDYFTPPDELTYAMLIPLLTVAIENDKTVTYDSAPQHPLTRDWYKLGEDLASAHGMMTEAELCQIFVKKHNLKVPKYGVDKIKLDTFAIKGDELVIKYQSANDKIRAAELHDEMHRTDEDDDPEDGKNGTKLIIDLSGRREIHMPLDTGLLITTLYYVLDAPYSTRGDELGVRHSVFIRLLDGIIDRMRIWLSPTDIQYFQEEMKKLDPAPPTEQSVRSISAPPAGRFAAQPPSLVRSASVDAQSDLKDKKRGRAGGGIRKTRSKLVNRSKNKNKRKTVKRKR